MSNDGIDELLQRKSRAAGEVVDVDEPLVKLVIFRLGERLWAIRGPQVREILPPATVFFLPGCPDSIEGVMNVRGDIASVIRLAPLLGVATGDGASRRETVLMARSSSITTGLRVGEVLDVTDLPESDIMDPPPNLADDLRPVVSGVFTFRDTPVTLIDLDPLLARFRASLG